MKAENTYMASIYMYRRLVLGLYGSYTYIYIYANMEPCTQSRADIYIYIYIYVYIYMLESWGARLNLAHAAQYGYRKLWYTTLSFYIY